MTPREIFILERRFRTTKGGAIDATAVANFFGRDVSPSEASDSRVMAQDLGEEAVAVMGKGNRGNSPNIRQEAENVSAAVEVRLEDRLPSTSCAYRTFGVV